MHTILDNRIFTATRSSLRRGAGNSVKIRPPIVSWIPWHKLRTCETQSARKLGSILDPVAGGRMEWSLANRSEVCVKGTEDMRKNRRRGWPFYSSSGTAKNTYTGLAGTHGITALRKRIRGGYIRPAGYHSAPATSDSTSLSSLPARLQASTRSRSQYFSATQASLASSS